MKVTYVGPHDGVELDLPDGRFVTVRQGEEVDVDDTTGRGLLDQPANWQAQPAVKKPAPAAKEADQ